MRRSEQSIPYKLGELPYETSLQLAVRDNRRSGAGPDCRAHRAALPGAQLPERQTRQHGRLRGEIADVDLALWRGAYRINGLQIVKVDGKVPVPFVKAPLIEFAVSWHSLWYDHAVVAEGHFVRPQINFVDGGANKQASQTGKGTDWQEQLRKLLPITLNAVSYTHLTLPTICSV